MSEPINDGGPAYPRLGEGFGNAKYEAVGLSKREAFAMAAMQGLVSFGATYGGQARTDKLAIDAVAYADALLAALSAHASLPSPPEQGEG